MSIEEFISTVSATAPPPGIGHLLEALWWDRKGSWTQAHDVVNLDETRAAARIHAYLHRKEGDAGNAAYWYRMAGESPATGSLDQEWRRLAAELLQAPA